MIACPACTRRVFTYREILSANVEGLTQCPVCGHVARLNQMSRILVGCALALLLFLALLHGDIFFSGYLFVFSTIFIFGGWRVIAAAALPVLSIEKAPGGFYLNRKQSTVMIAVLIVLAIAIDGFLSYRSDADRADAEAASRSVSTRAQ